MLFSNHSRDTSDARYTFPQKAGAVILSASVAVGLFFFPPLRVAAAQISPGNTQMYHVIDISHYDTMDWKSLPVGGSNGLAAIYMKATEGNTFTDSAVASEVAGAQSRGLPYGFYHFLHPKTASQQSEVASQAVYFYNAIKSYGYTCVAALDVEVMDGVSDADLVKSVHTFIDKFKSLSRQEIMIYADPDYINNHFQNDASLAQNRLWLADYGGSYVYPETPHTGGKSFDDVNIWKVWDMWQYTDALYNLSGAYTADTGGCDGDWATDGIFLKTASARDCIDYPNGGTYTDKVTVAGWEVARTGVKRVDFYLDNFQWLGSTSDLYARGDVQKAVNASGYYLDPEKCGFTFSFSPNALSDGKHTIHVAGISNGNTVIWDSRTFYTKDGAITQVDTSQTAQYYTTLPVYGWMLNRSGQYRADVYFDDFRWLGSNNGAFYSRPDVQAHVNAHNEYPLGAGDSGYRVSLSLQSVGPGKHTLWVAGIGKDKTVKWSKITFNVASSMLTIDQPTGTVSNRNLTVSGWALAHAGVKRVDVYLDLNKNGNAGFFSTSTFFNRKDVHTKIDPAGNYANSNNSGFSMVIPGSALSRGVHTLSVAAIGNDNTVQWKVVTFTVK